MFITIVKYLRFVNVVMNEALNFHSVIMITFYLWNATINII